MKRECGNCVHRWRDELDEVTWCLKHRSVISQDRVIQSVCYGCDDFWPKGRNPRCDECRFSEPHHTTGGAVVCYHSTTPNDECARADSSFCENWRAR